MPKFVPRERKHRRLAKQRDSASAVGVPTQNVNAELILPASAAEREARRKQLQDELRAQQPQDKISSKKRKRLEHYVETKLKKEENAELIKKLAKQKIDTNLLQSSKRLGQVNETKQETFRRALQERAAGIDVTGNQDDILFTKRRDVDLDDFHSLIQNEVAPLNNDESIDDKGHVGHSLTQPVQTVGSAFGSGLKRGLDSAQDGQPVMKRRKRRRRLDKQARKTTIPADDDDDDGDEDHDSVRHDTEEEANLGDSDNEWAGFDSDNREQDLKQTSGEYSSPVLSVQSDSISDDDTGVGSDASTSQEDSDGSSEDESLSSDDHNDKPERVSAFKQWAQSQRNDALGFTPSVAPLNDSAVRATFKPRLPSPDPVAQQLQSTTTSRLSRPQNALSIARSEDIQNVRLALPVVQEEQRIMEAIHNNPVVIVCGATGSGKTTQVPQMLFESGYGSHCGNPQASSSLQSRGMIGVTQPRRVAAVSVADRVATELGTFKTSVAHQVRYDTTVSKKTAIKFMTDGILLREINDDFVLSKYSAIVIDEAHERSVNTDILIGTLSRIVKLREDLAKEQPENHCPLKLIIMSATLRVADFAQNQRLFTGQMPPIVEAEGRQYPVTIHFARRTQRDYVADIVKKVSKGHRKLPAGAMLVFLTGQNEIMAAAKSLKKAIGDTAGSSQSSKGRDTSDEVALEVDDVDLGLADGTRRHADDDDDDSDAELEGLDDADDNDFDLGEADDSQNAFSMNGISHSSHAHILPLYAALPTVQQMRIFQPPPTGSRLIVLATNVAETSLTIPGIRYVFDCGRSKEKRYDQSTGVQTFEIDWISKASASQRTGRAGRTGPGHCWRLYSSAVYEEFFAEHSLPEILRSPIEGTILQLKAMNIDSVINFPFPTPPERSQLQTAETLLRNLSALDTNGKITAHGKALMQYPVSPRYSKMLRIAANNGVLQHAIALVAGLAVGDLYVPELQLPTTHSDTSDDEDDSENSRRRKPSMLATTEAQKRHQQYTCAQALLGRWDDRSDAVKLLTAVAVHADAVATDPSSGGERTSNDLFLREKGMAEVQQLRQQLHAIIRAQHRHSSLAAFKLGLPLASEKETKMLNQIVAAGFLDQIAVRADLLSNVQLGSQRKPRSAIEVPYRPLTALEVGREVADEDQELQKCVFVHPSSVLARLSKTEMPAYIVYSHLSRATAKTVGENAKAPRTRMHPLTSISAKALAVLAQDTPLLEFGKPIGKIEDRDGGKGRICWVAVNLRPSDGQSTAWPLGSWKVEQVRDVRGEWKIVRVLAR